jgi:CRISPR-associated protein Csm5
MNQFQQVVKAKVTCLSPVHIGSGIDFEPTNFKVRDGVLYGFDEVRLAPLLTEQERNALLAASNDKTNAVGRIQSFFKNLGEKALSIANTQVLLAPEVAKKIESELGRVQQKGDVSIFNKFNIQRTAFNPLTQLPYIPGSSIKGAIRTAVLSELNGGSPLREKETLNKKTLKDYNDKLQNKLLEKSPKEMSSDPFRLLKVGDAMANTDSVISRICYQINRKKVPGKHSPKEGISTFLQVIEAMSYGVFECEFSQWQRPDKHNASDGLKNKIPNKDLLINEVIDACNRFYLQHFERECALLRSNGYLHSGWFNKTKQLLQQYAPLFEKRQAMLLRVGKHSGAESVTIDGVRMIKIMTGKGKEDKILDRATTVWLAGEHARATSGMLPFGWILLEFGTNSVSNELAKVCEDFQAEVRAQYSNITEQIRNYQLQLKKIEENRKQQEAEEQQRAIEQQQRAAKLAKLSDEQRKIAELNELYQTEKAAGRLVPGCVVVNQLAEIIKIACAEWQKDDRLALEKVAREIYESTGQLKSKKFKQRLQELIKD